MTQHPKIEWLISSPDDGQRFIESLTTACRGNDRVAILLYHLLYEGAIVANREGVQKETVEYVRVTQSLDEIVAAIKKLRGKISKTTIKDWMEKLESWHFIKADGYHQQYMIFFHKIMHAINNPPEKELPKPRGRHAHSNQDSNATDHSFGENLNSEISDHSLNQDNKAEDHSFDYTNHSFKEEITVLRSQITTLTEDHRSQITELRSEISKLTFEITELRSEISKLRSSESSSTASIAALEAEISSLKNSIESNSKKETSKKESNADASDDQTIPSKPSSRKRSQKNKTQEPVTQPALPQEPQKQEPVLSEQGKVVWDAWCDQPWFKRARPNLTETAIGHCNALAESCNPLPTTEEMTEVRNWYQKRNAQCQGWHLGNLKKAYPEWVSENYKPTDQPAPSATPTAVFLSEQQASQLTTKLVASAQEKGHTIEAKVVVAGDNAFGIEVQWNTPLFEQPALFKSEKRLRSAYQAMCAVWEDNKKNESLAKKAVI